LFYGNTAQSTQGTEFNAIRFANDSLFRDSTTQLNIVTTGNAGEWAGRVLMLEGMSSQGKDRQSFGNQLANVNVDITKTGGNDWVLGGFTGMHGLGHWDIQEGRLILSHVRRAAADVVEWGTTSVDVRCQGSLVMSGS